MSDPQPAPGKNKPRRAEPLQPDLPGRGDETGSDEKVDIDQQAIAPENNSHPPEERTEEQKEQTENALKNVREGYA